VNLEPNNRSSIDLFWKPESISEFLQGIDHPWANLEGSDKVGLSEYLCMYMPVVVSSGSSVTILYPRESFDSWADFKGPVRMVCQSTTW
jgi:hypothetical protein